MFLVCGEVELKITNDKGDKRILDTLKEHGCTIGQYSVLFEEPFIFTVVAKTYVRLLVLDISFFINCRDSINDLDDAIVTAEKHIDKFGIPICDFAHFDKKIMKPLKRF